MNEQRLTNYWVTVSAWPNTDTCVDIYYIFTALLLKFLYLTDRGNYRLLIQQEKKNILMTCLFIVTTHWLYIRPLWE